MDQFIVDQQTSEELNLFGKYRHFSIFRLFNRTRTKGGERLLEQMLRHPFTEAKAIRERAAFFSFYKEHKIEFPFDEKATELWIEWMQTDQVSGKAGALLASFKKKIRQVAVGDDAYQQTVQGLIETGEVLKRCRAFIEKVQPCLIDAPDSLQGRLEEVKRITEHTSLQSFYRLSEDAAFAPLALARLTCIVKSELAASIQVLIDFIYETDVFTAVAAVAAEGGYTAARIAEHPNLLKVKGLRHPALEKAVGNDIVLSDEKNLLFLTGANMAGKSTIMKSTAIAVYLAHAGFPVAADHMEFSIKDGIYTSINVSDNVHLGYSHFYAEVMRVKTAAELIAAGKNMLVIFDELFKGTNVKDAYEGTLEVSQAFANYSASLFIVSTHIIEVGTELQKRSNVAAYYMPTLMKSERPVYTYQLTPGITEDRQGMLIIKNEGIVEILRQAAI